MKDYREQERTMQDYTAGRAPGYLTIPRVGSAVKSGAFHSGAMLMVWSKKIHARKCSPKGLRILAISHQL